jgi:hypothetical protein
MANHFISNSYQTPNAYVDLLMPYLTPEEWVVLSYAMRHIFGFDDRRATRRHRISLSCFEDGYAQYDGCGLGREAIMHALNSLSEYGIMLKIGEATEDGQEWELPLDPKQMKIKALMDRRSKTKECMRDRTAKARAAKLAKRQSVPQTETGLSHRPVENNEAVCPTDQPQSVPQTEGGLSHRQNQTDSQTHLQTQSARYRADALFSVKLPVPAGTWKTLILQQILPYLIFSLKIEEKETAAKDANKAVGAIIGAWLEETGIIDPKAYQNKTKRGIAQAIYEAGYTEDDVRGFIEDRYKEQFWRDKGITLENVAKDIARWAAVQDDDEDSSDHYVVEEENPDDPFVEMPAHIRQMQTGGLFSLPGVTR